MSRSLFTRNFTIFTILVALSYGTITWVVATNDKKLKDATQTLLLSKDISDNSHHLITSINSTVTYQRLHIVSGNPVFLEEHKKYAARIPADFEKTFKLVENNPAELLLLRSIEHDTAQLLKMLEERLALYKQNGFNTKVVAISGPINSLEKVILNTGEEMLALGSENMRKQIDEIEHIKSQYALSLLLGITVSSLLILVMNSILLKAQDRSLHSERELEIAEERLRLAIEGTADGVFDWDIHTGKVYYSPQFKKLVGYGDGDPFPDDAEGLRALIHPDDIKQLDRVLDAYFGGSLQEYSSIFRMKHFRGNWVWIKAGGKAIYNSNGEAIRLVGVHTDITLIRESEAKLVEAMQRAEEANRAKGDFLAHMSHEIRTPLTAISGIAEILEKQLDTMSEKQQKLITTLNASTSSLKDLITDILDFSKIESGEIDLENRKFNIEELFEQVISIMSGAARQKDLRFDFDYVHLRDAYFYGDAQRIRQVLINLIGNAIKFTQNGSVSVTAQTLNRQLHISVADTGIGISQEKLNIIFEQFKQADSSVSRRYGGTGLGLPISKRLSELMGGKLSVASEPNKGSTFTLTLPDVESLMPHIHNNESEGASPGVSQIQGGKGKVLVAEDYDGNVVVMSYLLDDLGYYYDIVPSGVEAVNMYHTNSYDLILMDVQMPFMDGFTATSKIREIEKEEGRRRTPIIGMTAHALIGDKEKCIAAGMDSYMPKPIDEQEFIAKVATYMSVDQKNI